MDPFDDPELPPLLSAALQRVDQGEPPHLEELCRARPDLLDAVRSSLSTSAALPRLHRASAAHDRYLGRTLAGRYRLDQRLGAGAMGVVYRGFDLGLSRPVAVKILRAHLFDGEEAEHRFAREAEVLAAIRHPAVVTVYDRGRTADDDPYLIMELFEGLPLSELLDAAKRDSNARACLDSGWIARVLGTARLDESNALRLFVRWAADLAGGLATVHQTGVFHRDLKPSNVFLLRDGHPVLLDFGLAAHADRATITRENTTLGTPAYMAPESLAPGHRPSAATDVYGLTATLYHALTLRPPYDGTPSQILSTLLVADAPPVGSLRPGLPRDLQAILARGMARRPSERYPSAEALEHDLRAFLDHRPIQARPPAPWTRAWRRLRGSPWVLSAATLLLVASTAILVDGWLAQRRARRDLAYRELWSHVPPALTLNQPESRRLSEAEGRSAVDLLLEKALRVAPDPLQAGAVRAAFLLDQGDPSAAARALAAVVAAHPSAYSRALLARYFALPSGAQAASDLELEGMPSPEDPVDAYLAAFHALRAGNQDEARDLLDRPGVVALLPALELRALLSSRDPTGMLERAQALERLSGRRTASAAHLLGIALLLEQRYAAAREVIADGLELAPMSAALHLNAGLAAWRLGDLPAARTHCETSLRLEPGNFLGYQNLVRVLMDAGELETAQAVLARAPGGEPGAHSCDWLVLEGELLTERALARWNADDAEPSVSWATQALARFAAAERAGARVRTPRRAIAASLADRDPDGVFEALAKRMHDEPLHARSLGVFLRWMPEEFDVDDVRAVREYLACLQESLAINAAARSAALPPSRP